MQKLILLLTLTMSVTFLYGQDNFTTRMKEIVNEIKAVKQEEKEALKADIEEINKRLENNEISAEEASRRKKEAAEKSAEKIESRVEGLEDEMEDLIEKTVEGALETDEEEDKMYDEDTGELKFKLKPLKEKKMKGEPRTTSQAVLALGVNTLVQDRDLSTIDNNTFQLSNARFYELGFSYKTRVFAKTNFLHIKYGLSLHINNVRPNDNQHFVKNGNVTSLETDVIEYSKDAYFRTAQFVAPVYFEFDFTKPKKQDDVIKFKTQQTFRFGVGGYAGLNTRSRQVTHYTDDKIKYEVNARGNYNVNNFIYGVGAYIGYKEMSLYGKMDLNNLFSGESVAYNNVSVGLRWDLH